MRVIRPARIAKIVREKPLSRHNGFIGSTLIIVIVFMNDSGRVLACGHQICFDCTLDLRNSPIAHDGVLYVVKVIPHQRRVSNLLLAAMAVRRRTLRLRKNTKLLLRRDIDLVSLPRHPLAITGLTSTSRPNM